MKTLQEIFDESCIGLLKQGYRSMRSGDADHVEICAYHGDRGRRCAVGQLLPASVDTDPFEGAAVGFFDYKREPKARLLHNALREAGVDIDAEPVRQLLIRLQAIHDELNEFSPREATLILLLDEWSRLAKYIGLSMEKVQAASKVWLTH